MTLERIRREPYRVLFPLAILLAWAGVVPWLLYGLKLSDAYPAPYHAMTQIQGALTCFGFGFLLTFIPRRTGTAPAPGWALLLFCLAPIVTAVFAWQQQWVIAQLAWWVTIVVLIIFILVRQRQAHASRKLEPGFVWVPITLGACLVATFTAGIGAANAPDWMWLHEISSRAILQGLFVGFILGVGSLLLPLLTRGQGYAPGSDRPHRGRDRLFHVLLALVYFGSFPLEHWAVRPAFALRTAVILAAFLFFIQLWRRPTEPGLSRWLIWIAAWMLPLGYLQAAAFPEYRLIGFHILFIGGFWTLAATVSSHVALSHAGQAERTRSWPWTLYAMGGLLAVAILGRALIMLDAEQTRVWMAVAASAFLLSTLPWLVLVLPMLPRLGEPPSHGPGALPPAGVEAGR